ncbi:MAG: hypothetical protein FWF09_03985 [Bacteroidales bacterium]|nr:hypothetical protein [Bacteroidales bacterium]
MFKNSFNLKNVAIMIACFAVCTVFSGCEKEEDPINPPPPPPETEAIELISPITVNTTLKDLGLPIDYVFKGGYLIVKDNAVLTIEPGVTIQFTSTNGDGTLSIDDGATIVAIGTAEKPIQFIGNGTQKGSWGTVQVNTNSDNKFKYCEFINGGGSYNGALSMRNIGGTGPRISVQYCKIIGSKKYGFDTYGNDFTIDAFDNNTITGGEDAPVSLYNLKMAAKFDMTSNLTGNANDYVRIERNENMVNTTLNETTVPYYCVGNWSINKTLTINEGVTICMHTDVSWSDSEMGKIVVNGTQAKPVTFTRLPGMTYYWGSYGGLRFSRNNGSELNWCVMEYVKNDMAAIDLSYEGYITLNNCTIRNNQGYGVNKGRGNHCDVVVNHSGTNERFSNNALGNVILCNSDVVSVLP